MQRRLLQLSTDDIDVGDKVLKHAGLRFHGEKVVVLVWCRVCDVTFMDGMSQRLQGEVGMKCCGDRVEEVVEVPEQVDVVESRRVRKTRR